MKTEPNNPNDESLRAALRQWRMDTPLPPRFQEQVWRKIEAQRPRTSASIGELIIEWFRSSTVRPALAVAYAVILLALGLTGGVIQAHRQNARIDDMARTRYIQSLDPYVN